MAAPGVLATALVGAKLGAILCGRRRMRVDGGGLGNPHFQMGWMAVNAHGHCLAIYGSGRWVFESPPASCGKRGDSSLDAQTGDNIPTT